MLFLTTSVTVPSVNMPAIPWGLVLPGLFVVWLIWPFLMYFRKK